MTTSGHIARSSRVARPGAGLLQWVRDRSEAARRSPARLALAVFALVILAVTALLSLPAATTTGQPPPFVEALFTATSAVCVTGLTTVDTATYWSTFGQVVIMVAIKVGGLGIITLASLLGLAVSRRLGLRQRLLAASETKALRLGEVRHLLRTVVVVSTTAELLIAAVLLPSFLRAGEGVGEATYHALFYGISSFNNAGFAVHENGLLRWSGDAFVLLPLAAGVFVGSLGFPVLLAIGNGLRRVDGVRRGSRCWNLHTRLTVTTTLLLLVFAVVAFAASEWTNPRTLGGLDTGHRVLASVFAGVMPRTGGFAALDVSGMNQTTWALQDLLMFVGGGSASTAGGIKVTTVAVLVLATIAEARGDRDVDAFGRRLPPETLRLAVAVLLVAVTLVLAGTLALLAITHQSLDVVLFEAVSAFGTCGLSTGLTPHLPDAAKYVLTALMFTGRTGTMTLAAALALRERRRVIRLPEERPVVG